MKHSDRLLTGNMKGYKLYHKQSNRRVPCKGCGKYPAIQYLPINVMRQALIFNHCNRCLRASTIK